jgi:hypothetical protein
MFKGRDLLASDKAMVCIYPHRELPCFAVVQGSILIVLRILFSSNSSSPLGASRFATLLLQCTGVSAIQILLLLFILFPSESSA